MDTIGALALATKGPFDSLLDRPPYGESGALLSKLMYRNIIVHAIFQASLCLLILFGSQQFFGLDISVPRAESTFLFNTFVFCQVYNLLNARITDQTQGFFEGFFSNYYFWAFFALIVAVQALIVQFGGTFFGTSGLEWRQWLWSVGLSAIELIVGAILRYIPIKDDTRERLIVNRETKREEMRRRYTGMTASMMWLVSERPSFLMNTSKLTPQAVEEAVRV
jgi:Ca2+-transporting ATPase